MISSLNRGDFGEFRIRTLKSIIFVLLCLPALSIGYSVINGSLVEPVKELTLATGEWSIRILLLTLAVTPLRRLTGWGKLVRIRRMLGLFSFFYMLSHFLIYLILDRYLFWPDIIKDFTERPYIIAGLTCLLLCTPLAITSTDGMVRRLGGRLWKKLHKLVYFAAIAAVLHFVWLVKSDVTEPIVYGAILVLLFTERLRNTKHWSFVNRKVDPTAATTS